VWQGAQALSSVSNLLTESHVTVDTVRGVTAGENVDLLLEKLRQQRARIISVTPLHGTLEDYFVAHTSDREQEVNV
jgi:hypothetical protein